ncbi:MAG TPA: hypothetical protein VF463_19690 [Sphingobium sp.]
MYELQAQRVLIAYIRRYAPHEYSIWRAELRNDFADVIAALPEGALRVYYGQVYRNRKAAMVIANARYIAVHK